MPDLGQVDHNVSQSLSHLKFVELFWRLFVHPVYSDKFESQWIKLTCRETQLMKDKVRFRSTSITRWWVTHNSKVMTPLSDLPCPSLLMFPDGLLWTRKHILFPHYQLKHSDLLPLVMKSLFRCLIKEVSKKPISRKSEVF